MRPVLLMYALDGQKAAKIRLLCMKLKIRAQVVYPAQYLLPLGALLENHPAANAPYSGSAFSEEMLVLSDFSQKLLEDFLRGFAAAHIPAVSCKAVVTPSNLGWSSLTLHAELLKEHAAMTAARQGFDVVIRGGMVLDGSGAEAFRADVGISDGRITAVGDLSAAQAGKTVDAAGKYVCPGFVDIHRHADAAVFRPGFGELELRQGLTTIVNGNCGLSAAPIAEENELEIRRYLQPITGVLGPTVPTGSLAEYLRAADRLPVSVGMLAGAGVLRANCAGYGTERLTDAHYAALHRQLEQVLQDGALGISLGLGYAPECFYTTQELLQALLPLQDSGVPITVHMREEGDGVCDSVREMLAVARALRTPVHISHLKAMGRRNWNMKIPQALALLADARSEGLAVDCDVYPYTAGSTQLMHILPPDFLTGGTDAVTLRLREPGQRALLAARIRDGRDFDNIAQLVGWDNIIMSTLNRPENKPYEGMTVQSAARLKGIDPLECCCDMLCSEHCAVTMIDFITCESDIAAILQAPFSNVISDSTYPTEGMPHPRLYGTFARMVEKYVLQDGVLTLPEAVHKMTMRPADVLGLRQKGRLTPGADADVLVFDPSLVRERGSYALPKQLAEGFETVLVGGQLAVENGVVTGACGGRVLRRG